MQRTELTAAKSHFSIYWLLECQCESKKFGFGKAQYYSQNVETFYLISLLKHK